MYSTVHWGCVRVCIVYSSSARVKQTRRICCAHMLNIERNEAIRTYKRIARTHITSIEPMFVRFFFPQSFSLCLCLPQRSLSSSLSLSHAFVRCSVLLLAACLILIRFCVSWMYVWVCVCVWVRMFRASYVFIYTLPHCVYGTRTVKRKRDFGTCIRRSYHIEKKKCSRTSNVFFDLKSKQNYYTHPSIQIYTTTINIYESAYINIAVHKLIIRKKFVKFIKHHTSKNLWKKIVFFFSR